VAAAPANHQAKKSAVALPLQQSTNNMFGSMVPPSSSNNAALKHQSFMLEKPAGQIKALKTQQSNNTSS